VIWQLRRQETAAAPVGLTPWLTPAGVLDFVPTTTPEEEAAD